MKKTLKETDAEVYSLIEEEKKRTSEGIELIPSENVVSPAVLEAMGSILTNKYAEGYPGKRYYGGNQVIDKVENLAISRAKWLFGAEHVNVQPYSGSPANFAVYSALVPVGGRIMGMRLDMGGHLTHGHKVSYSGKYFNFSHYGVDKNTELLDYDEIRKLAKEFKPEIIVSGATAYPRKIDFKAFKEIAEEVGAISMSDISHISGLIVGGKHPSPLPFTDIVTTTTHKTLRGPRAAMIMCKEQYAKAIDMSVFPGLQGGPHENVIAAIAVALHEASTPSFREYADQIVKNAQALADSLMENNIRLVTGGTDNHLMIADLTSLNISGKQAETLLDSVGITVNKNTIPYDPRSPMDPSGIRIGTPYITTLGMKTGEMKDIGLWISQALKNPEDKSIHEKIHKNIKELSKEFAV